MKWYKKQLAEILKKTTAPKPARTAKKIAAKATAPAAEKTPATPRTTKQAYAKGVNSMAQRNKNRPKTDLY